MDCLETLATWHHIDPEQIVPMIKRDKQLFARIQESAVSLNLIKPPKKRGRGGKTS
jgi:hypothetical protein